MAEPLTQTAFEFALTRRSRPAKLLCAPAPTRPELEILLTAAARTPDHGKLEPWRFIVLEAPALQRLAGLVAIRGQELGLAEDQITKAVDSYANAPLAIVVVATPKPSEKVPQIEQTLSAGAVCLSCLNAALAAGWGANWLSGWTSHDRPFIEANFGLIHDEWVAGIIHIGTARQSPPDRPRPDIKTITQWVSQ